MPRPTTVVRHTLASIVLGMVSTILSACGGGGGEKIDGTLPSTDRADTAPTPVSRLWASHADVPPPPHVHTDWSRGPIARSKPIGMPPAECSRVSTATCNTAFALKRGINMGNMLESPMEGQWGITYHSHYPATVKGAGFNHVRLPIRWSSHASTDANAIIDPIFFARVDQIVSEFLAQGLYVIVNMHHYRQLDGDALDTADGEVTVDPHVIDARFIHLWRQIAAHYQAFSDHLIFEIYNEPHGLQTAAEWNARYPKALAAIRETNPTRVVMVGPSGWYDTTRLVELSAPTDVNTIVTFHHYEPFAFTHQGAWGSPYPGGSRTCCSRDDLNQIASRLDIAKQWAMNHGHPVYLGEFGSHVSAPRVSRINHANALRLGAESRNISWAVWNFGADFGLYNTTTDAWDTLMQRALTP